MIVPVVTLAFLLTSQAPAVNVSKVIMEEGRFEKAIVEIYRGEQVAAAPAVDYNQVPKNYEVKVYIDRADNPINFTQDSGKPFIALDRTFVPYRIMSEALGAKVDWDGAVRKVTAEGNGNIVELFIGKQTYKVNGKDMAMDVEPFILSAEGRTYIPARYLTEGLNYTIDFANDGKVMYIVSFTQGQNEAQRKAVLDQLVKGQQEQVKDGIKSIGEIVGGKLTQEQARQLQSNISTQLYKAGYEWREWQENDPVHKEFEKAIKDEMKKIGLNNIIVDSRMFAKDRTGSSDYFAIAEDGKVYIINVGIKVDKTVDAAVIGGIPGML